MNQPAASVAGAMYIQYNKNATAQLGTQQGQHIHPRTKLVVLNLLPVLRMDQHPTQQREAAPIPLWYQSPPVLLHRAAHAS